MTSLDKSTSEKNRGTKYEPTIFRQKSSFVEKEKFLSKSRKRIKSLFTNTTELSFRNEQYLNKIEFAKFDLAAPQFVDILIE